MTEPSVDGPAAVEAARNAVRAMVEHDSDQAHDQLAGLGHEELVAAAAALAYTVASVERVAPTALDGVWDAVESQVAGVEVDRGLRGLFGEDP